VSDLLAAGVNPRLVSSRVGHASVGFTLQVYGHVTPTMDQELARRMDGAMRQVLGWQTGSKSGGDVS
jgi:hypothetical protein